MSTKEWITPETAKKYLKRNNLSQKKLDQKVVDEIADKIISGNWDPDGAAIFLTSNGRILSNGQHRMHAIIKANIPVEVLVGRIYEK